MNENEKKYSQSPMSEIDPAVIRQIKLNQTVQCLRALMASLEIGPDRAMELLRLPRKERKSYKAILTNNKEKKHKQSGNTY